MESPSPAPDNHRTDESPFVEDDLTPCLRAAMHADAESDRALVALSYIFSGDGDTDAMQDVVHQHLASYRKQLTLFIEALCSGDLAKDVEPLVEIARFIASSEALRVAQLNAMSGKSIITFDYEEYLEFFSVVHIPSLPEDAKDIEIIVDMAAGVYLDEISDAL